MPNHLFVCLILNPDYLAIIHSFIFSAHFIQVIVLLSFHYYLLYSCNYFQLGFILYYRAYYIIFYTITDFILCRESAI